MGRTACTEPQCLYNGALYLYHYRKIGELFILLPGIDKTTLSVGNDCAVRVTKVVLDTLAVWATVCWKGLFLEQFFVRGRQRGTRRLGRVRRDHYQVEWIIIVHLRHSSNKQEYEVYEWRSIRQIHCDRTHCATVSVRLKTEVRVGKQNVGYVTFSEWNPCLTRPAAGSGKAKRLHSCEQSSNLRTVIPRLTSDPANEFFG